MRKMILTLALLGLGATTVCAAIFPHEVHIDQYVDGDCAACHKSGDMSIVPDFSVCTECHEEEFINQVSFSGLVTHGPLWSMQHRQEARRDYDTCLICHDDDGEGAVGCAECHTSGFADEMGKFSNSMTNIHRSEFKVSHPIAARTDPQLCNSCHENSFCVDCHEDFNAADLSLDSHRKGWSSIAPTGVRHDQFTAEMCQACHPGSVLPSHEWSSSHAREARRNLATCQACHPDGDVCLTCHSARSGLGVNPHPSDWEDFDDRLRRASDGKTCRKCH